MENKEYLVVILSVMIFFVNITISNQNTWNWFEAQQYCSNANDTLKTNDISPNSLQHWTGFYRRYSPCIKLLGCYDSEVVNKHKTYHFHFNFTSAGFCQELCASVNSTHFGIQLDECACFENPIFAETISPAQCNYTCYDVEDEAGIKFLECGGPNAYTLYKSEDDGDNNGTACLAINCGTIKKFSLSSECSESYHGACAYKEYLGCFQDQPNRTLQGKNNETYSMTVEFCRNFCKETLFYGVEFSGQCFCGNIFTSVIRKREEYCNMKCHRNKTQFCGGSWSMNIYSNPNYKTERYTNWSSSMQICKTLSPSSYLTGNISLTNANLACKQMQRTQEGVYWLSIAKEEYTGYDRGVVVNVDDRTTFHQCQLCNKTGCYFSDCFQRLRYFICEKASGIEIAERRATFSDANINLHVIIPLSLGVIILFGCLVIGIVYYKRQRSNQTNEKTALSNLNENKNVIETHTTGMHHSDLKHEKENARKHFDDTYQESADGVYDHLRDTGTRKCKTEDDYDHAPVVKDYAYGGFGAKISEQSESTYDHIVSISVHRQNNMEENKMDDYYAQVHHMK